MTRIDVGRVFLFPTFFLTLFPVAAQSKLVYRQETGGVIVRVVAWEDRQPPDRALHIEMSDGERYNVLDDTSSTTLGYRYEDPSAATLYSALRVGNVIRIEGVLKGKPVSRSLQVDSHPWLESMERSLQSYAKSGSPEPLLFWCVIPSDAAAFLLMARIEGTEEILVNENKVVGVKVRVSLPGFAALFWSVLFWYRPSDGTFLRYEGVRGFWPTPKTTMELVEGNSLGP